MLRCHLAKLPHSALPSCRERRSRSSEISLRAASSSFLKPVVSCVAGSNTTEEGTASIGKAPPAIVSMCLSIMVQEPGMCWETIQKRERRHQMSGTKTGRGKIEDRTPYR